MLKNFRTQVLKTTDEVTAALHNAVEELSHVRDGHAELARLKAAAAAEMLELESAARKEAQKAHDMLVRFQKLLGLSS